MGFNLALKGLWGKKVQIAINILYDNFEILFHLDI